MQQLYQKNTGIVIEYLITAARGSGTLKAYESCYHSLGEACIYTRRSTVAQFILL